MEKKLPKGWVISSINECTDILDSQRKAINSTDRQKMLGDIPYYGATGIVGYINDYIFNEELVLLGEDGAPFFNKLKNVAFKIQKKSWVNNHAHVLRAKNITSNVFLLHYLNFFNYEGYVGGTTRLKLTQGDLKKIPYPLPPLAEQERIANKLDELFARIELIKKSMDKIPQLLKDFRQQVLTSAVTGKLTEEWRGNNTNSIKFGNKYEIDFSISVPKNWIVTAVGNIFKFQQGMQIAKSTRLLIPIPGSLPLLRIKNYHDGFIKDVEYIKVDEKSLIAEEHDIIMTRTGESRGWVLTGYKGVFHNNTFRINFDKDFFNNRFIYYQLSSNQIQNYIKIKSGRTGQPDLSHKMFSPCPFAIPPLAEQEEIVKRVESLFAKADQIEEQYKALKEKIDVLPQLLLHKAFKGELVEQLPTDGDAADLLKEIMALKKK